MKTVCITGINRGLGKELFHLFLSKGYQVFGVLRNEATASSIEADLPPNGHIITADLSADTSIDKVRESVRDASIDLLINNAGIAGSAFLLENTESTEILELINVHCLGVFRTVKALQNNLLKAQSPLVLNLNSRFGSITRQSEGTYRELDISYSYRIAKAAQNMLTTSLRREFEDRIKFVSLHPGKMKTEIAQVDADLDPKAVAAQIVSTYENGSLREENGIVELGKGVIEW